MLCCLVDIVFWFFLLLLHVRGGGVLSMSRYTYRLRWKDPPFFNPHGTTKDHPFQHDLTYNLADF